MRDLGELEHLGIDVRGQELQHLECRFAAPGAILGRQQRGMIHFYGLSKRA